MMRLIILLLLSLVFLNACEQAVVYENKDTDYSAISEINYKDEESGNGHKVSPKKAAEIYVEDKVVQELEKNGRAVVVIELNDENLKDKEGEELRRIIQENQKKLLEVLSSEDFKLITKFDKVNAITAEITMNGFQKLKSMPHLVEGIKSVRIVLPNVPASEV